MKRLLIIAALLVAISSIEAQPRKQMGKRGDQEMIGMGSLQLTDAQKQQLKDLRKAHQLKVQEIQNNDKMSQGDARKKATELFEQHEQDILKILTPEQQATWKKEKQKRDDLRNAEAKARLEKMKIQLELTPEQVAKIEALQAKNKPNVAGPKQPNDMRQKGREHMEEMKAILTEEQWKKWQSIAREGERPMQHRKGRMRQ
jgi:Spy/CpxP family protein refolding chaperone